MTVKERALHAIQELPEAADRREVASKLDFILAVDEGLEQARAGRVLSVEEVRRRLAPWLIE